MLRTLIYLFIYFLKKGLEESVVSYKLVGLVVIPVGAFLGAFVQPFVIDGDRGRRPRVFDALLFGKQGLEGVSSVTRVGWAGRDLSGGLSGCICAVLRGRS